MSDGQNLENLDLDLQRRIRMSHLAVLVILCLASIWLVLLLIFDDKFGALISGTVALALATGEVAMAIPETVKVVFQGTLKNHIDFRDVVHSTQAQMLDQFGENVFQGRVIEVHIGTLLSDQAFTFTDWTAEMKAKASVCISNDETLAQSLKISIQSII